MNSRAHKFQDDFTKVVTVLETNLPDTIDGQTAIIAMRDGGSRNWKQMEWIGFWFEFVVETQVLEAVDGKPGPKFGRTQFDLMLNAPWDLKAHPADVNEVILNDVAAVDQCIHQFGVINYLLLKGDVVYDEMGTFKNWHDSLKGKPSRYVVAGLASGRRNRVRKTNFSPHEILGIQLDQGDIRRGEAAGWISRFQKGMANANGRPRKPKYRIHLDKIDGSVTSASSDLSKRD